MAEVLSESVNIVLDQIQVISFTAVAWPEEQSGIGVVYALGHDDGNGNFVPVKRKEIGFTGEDYQRIVSSSVNGSINLYENIKAALYTEIANAQN